MTRNTQPPLDLANDEGKTNASFKVKRFRFVSKTQAMASVASIIILSLALLTLWVGHGLSETPEKTVMVRELTVATPPPPPPPPVVQQQAEQAPVTVQVEGAGASVQMVKVTQEIVIDKPDMPNFKPQETQWQSLEVDWDALELSDLDGLPSLLTILRVKWPKSLSRKGIKKALVKLDVIIDEHGQVSLVDIVSNPYPQLESEIKSLVRRTKFTAPQKDGQPARARFIWPVEISS
ncbi:energy transducer TonB [Alteromonas sp. 1_MG-2023]|uniref:energy transducer TonB n=1 Tax=Alteromonas sp. 1_MG-2023 TaxID=3062669 RepID=UPI0026E39962|nr:energy transducer TonB [Alteromonas sp. 1_MG-2023]MDO6567711.1 energy transducer TonB [Alteromonas sp. 1_MG-2023]